jgi:hypothetical protein
MAMDIATQFQQSFEQPLVEALKEEISGDFLKACLQWIEGTSPTGDNVEEGTEEWQALELEDVHTQVVCLIDHICERDAVMVRKACKGLGTDKDALTDVLLARPKEHLKRVDVVFTRIYNRTLRQQVKDETSGDYGKLLKFSVEDPMQLDCELLYKAMKGMGATKTTLTDVIVARSAQGMEVGAGGITDLKKAYKERYQKDLAEQVKSETGGEQKRCLKVNGLLIDSIDSLDEGSGIQVRSAVADPDIKVRHTY